MRICRYKKDNQSQIGFFGDDYVISVQLVFSKYAHDTAETPSVAPDDVLECLPGGNDFQRISDLYAWFMDNRTKFAPHEFDSHDQIDFLVPIPYPNKLFLLAGNYSAHVEEGGEIGIERAETYPYVFMKPPTTTLVGSGTEFALPSISPKTIDYELELAVVIGKTAKNVSEQDALDHVAGYTIINDISDRKFKPNPDRRERKRDAFFDWLHGKWHDGGCPCGPCVVPSTTIRDPQNLKMQLSVNGEVRQDASTSLQVFPVAAVIEFISSFVTLEPGDIISTGTPAGVGGPQGIFLKSGDLIEASIESIGTLVTKIL